MRGHSLSCRTEIGKNLRSKYDELKIFPIMIPTGSPICITGALKPHEINVNTAAFPIFKPIFSMKSLFLVAGFN